MTTRTKTIHEWMEMFGYEPCEGYNYESVYPFRSLLDFRTAKQVVIDAMIMGVIKRKEGYKSYGGKF